MIDSFELYKAAVHLATNSPIRATSYAENAGRLKNYYLQLVTMTFFELMTRKTSPLISALCKMNKLPFTPKNFKLTPAQMTLPAWETDFDLVALVYGLNAALTKNLAECQRLYVQNARAIFRKERLPKDDVQELLNQLAALDEGIGKFFAAERIIEVPAAQDDDLIQDLSATAKERRAADEKIIAELSLPPPKEEGAS